MINSRKNVPLLVFDEEMCGTITKFWKRHAGEIITEARYLPEDTIRKFFDFFGGLVTEIKIAVDFWQNHESRVMGLLVGLAHLDPELTERDRSVLTTIVKIVPAWRSATGPVH